MESKTENEIYNLMQNVIDKLEAVENEISAASKLDDGSAIIKEVKKLRETIFQSMNSQTHLIIKSQENATHLITTLIKENETIPSITNNREFSLFGGKSILKPKSLILFLISLVIIWCSIKYLPYYYIEYSTLKKEKEEYKLFYEFVFLNEFKKDGNITANRLLMDIKNKDSLLFKEHTRLLNTYEKEMRRRELLKQLKRLEQ